jgi:tetratricopeptide (TPR) repeat protein
VAQQQVEQAIAIQRQEGLQGDLANSLGLLGDLQLTRGDLPGARRSYDESLKLATDLRSPAGIASSRSSIAELALAENRPSEAATLAAQAAEAFQQEKLVDQEAGARNVAAKALLAEGEASEALAEVNAATSLSPQDRTVRLSLAVTAARVKGRLGNAADAKKELEACMADAAKMKLLGSTFEIALAEAEVQGVSDPSSALARLHALGAETKAKGYMRIATEAERERQELARKVPRAG